MDEYSFNIKFSELNKAIAKIASDIDDLKKVIKPEDDLWDGYDIKKNWKVSQRTLAEWRKNRLLGYVKINNKIFYPREQREKFLSSNSIDSINESSKFDQSSNILINSNIINFCKDEGR